MTETLQIAAICDKKATLLRGGQVPAIIAFECQRHPKIPIRGLFPIAMRNFSHHLASYLGVLIALEYLRGSTLDLKEVRIHTHSQMVVNQMSRRWKAKDGFYIPAYQALCQWVRDNPDVNLTWKYSPCEASCAEAVREFGDRFIPRDGREAFERRHS